VRGAAKAAETISAKHRTARVLLAIVASLRGQDAESEMLIRAHRCLCDRAAQGCGPGRASEHRFRGQVTDEHEEDLPEASL
jgi:hypothetical protein